MRILVNNEPREVDDAQTLDRLIRALGLADAPCATEVNQILVPKRDRPAHVLREGDAVEVVTLVGGG